MTSDHAEKKGRNKKRREADASADASSPKEESVFRNMFRNATEPSSSRDEPSGETTKRKPHRQERPIKRPKKERPDKKLQPIYHKKEGPPSESALFLSASLKDLSAKKLLREALALYWDKSNDPVRDGHHASIMVDCCSRCGSVEDAEKIIQSMKDGGAIVSVHANTALMKGYAHSGRIEKGLKLYKEMCSQQNERNRPNVRTLNTLLRGCLWTAVTLTGTAIALPKDDKNKKHVTVGGVVTCEEAWASSRSPRIKFDFDISSFEYSVALLCQALRVDEAGARILEMKAMLAEDGTERGADGAEPLIVAYVSLARAHALLGQREKAKETAEMSIEAFNVAVGGEEASGDKDTSSSDKIVKESGKMGATGGKRAWRKDDTAENDSRSTSNTLFRKHRLSELKIEADAIAAACTHKAILPASSRIIASLMLTRLLYFSGGGTTEIDATKNTSTDQPVAMSRKSRVESVREQLLHSLWLSFGLGMVVGRPNTIPKTGIAGFKISKTDLRAMGKVCGKRHASVIDDDGRIDFSNVFSPLVRVKSTDSSTKDKSHNRPLNIELGAGSGDWIVMQASANPLQDYVAVELRADRIFQTFSKAALNLQQLNSTTDPVASLPLTNVCCVGSECGSFLRERLREDSVSTVFVNHPEPPTQTYGSENDLPSTIASGNEPAHMLHSSTLLSVSKCLQKDGRGRMIIVTDNRWYANLICITLQNIMSKDSQVPFRQIDLDGVQGLRRSDTFKVTQGKDEDGNAKGHHVEDIVLFVGQPSESIGHYVPKSDSRGGGGNSYFDRLWRTGVGAHAEARDRYIIAMTTTNKK